MSKFKKRFLVAGIAVMVVAGIVAPGGGGVQAVTAAELQVQIDALLATLADLQTQLATLDGGTTSPGTITGIPSGFTFDSNLSQGSSNSDVMYLQILLNSDAATKLADSGAGSPGNETQYFGPITNAGVIKFQEKYTAEVLTPVGLTLGTGFFGPSTRSKANSLLASGVVVTPPGDDTGDGDTGTTPPTTGSVVVSLSTETPVARTVADDTYVLLGVWDFTGPTDATIDSLKFTRRGVGAPADFTRVYLYDGENRLSSGVSITSDTNIAEFNNLRLTFASTKELSLWGDLKENVSGTTHYFEISSSSDVVVSGAASVSGSFPMSSNTITTAAVTEGGITVNSGSTAANVSLGEQAAVVEKFNIQATTEDANVMRITMRQTGTADMSQLTNWTLHYSPTGEKIADGTVYGKYIVFTIPGGYAIKDGSTRSFEMRADVGAGLNPGDAITLAIQQGIDIYAVGGTYGYGVPTDSTSHSGDAVQVEGGVVTFTDGGPSARDVKRDANDLVVLSGTITSEIPVTVQELDIVIVVSANLNNSELTDIRFRNAATGATLIGPVTPPGSGDGVDIKIDLDANFVVSGTLNWEITLDVAAAATAGETFSVSLATSANDISGVSSLALPLIEDFEGNVVGAADIIPSTNILGETMTIQAASLNVGLASIPVGDTYVQGTQDVPFLGITLTAAEADSITVEEITFNAYTAAGNIEDIVSSLRIVDESGNLVSVSAKNINTTGDTVVFSGLNKTIAAGSTVRWTLIGNIAGTVSTDRSIGFDIVGNAVNTDPDALTMTANVVASDSEGNTVPVYDEDGTADAGDWENADTQLNDDVDTGLVADGNESDVDVEIEIIQAGSLTAVLGANTPLTQIIDGGTTGVNLTDVTFFAVDESYTIEKMTIVTTLGGNFTNVTASWDGGSVSGSFIGSSATFTGMTMVVPVNGEATVSFIGEISSVTLASSGTTLDVDWNVSATFRALSNSGTTITDGTTVSSTITGSDHAIRKTQLVITDASTSSTLSNGTVNLLAANLSTANSNNAAIKRLVFSFNESTDRQIDNLVFKKAGANYNTSVTITNGTGTDLKGSGDNLDNGDVIIVTFNTEELITSAPKKYSLEAIASSIVDGDSVTVALVNETGSLANNRTAYFVGDVDARLGTNGESRIMRFIDGATITASTDVVVWYDIDGNGTYTDGTDPVLGLKGTAANEDGATGTVLPAAQIIGLEANAANDTLGIAWDPDATADTQDPGAPGVDFILLGGADAAEAGPLALTVVLISDGVDLTLYHEADEVDANWDNAADFVVGVGIGDNVAGTDVADNVSPYATTNLNVIWSDRAALPHTVNSADFTNGNLLNSPNSDLSSVKNTLSS